jgi:hypothetical protein
MRSSWPLAAEYYQFTDYLSTDDKVNLQLAAAGVRNLKTQESWHGPGL